MKRILIYGDSNTWGQDESSKRYQESKQWARILSSKLGVEYCVVQEGLSGRTAGDYSSVDQFKKGQYCFETIYKTASPLDLVIIALGTNDLKAKYGAEVKDITENLLWYDAAVQKFYKEYSSKKPNLVYVLVPNFDVGVDEQFGETEEQKRKRLNAGLKEVIQHFIEINNLEMSIDGLHFSEQAHEDMAAAVFKKIRELENGI